LLGETLQEVGSNSERETKRASERELLWGKGNAKEFPTERVERHDSYAKN